MEMSARPWFILPLSLQPSKRKKWCFISNCFFKKRVIHLPQQPSPKQPKNLNQERINRNTTCNLLSGEEEAAAWLKISQKNCSPRQKEVPSVAPLLPLLSCESHRQALDRSWPGKQRVQQEQGLAQGAVYKSLICTPAQRVTPSTASLPSPLSQPYSLSNKEEWF